MYVKQRLCTTHRSSPSSRPNGRWRWILIALGMTFIAASCGDDEPEITMAERLAEVEGRELREAELADRLAVGDTLCQMDDAVLDAIWRQLNERQLNYQDVVFGHICPDRSVFYASLTGRYVTDEAVESGVVPSTTRPPRTTVPPASTTTTASPPVATETSAADAEPDPTGDESDGDENQGEDDETTTVLPASTTTPTVATTTAVITTSTAVSTTAAATTSSATTVEGEGG